MPSTIKIFLTALIVLLSFPSLAQSARDKDLGLWTWLQVEKNMKKGQYFEFQYQTRFTENISQFNRTNLYFIYGKTFLQKRLQVEALYQLNLNHTADQHTLFLGATYKQKLKGPFLLYFRTAVQYIRNDFTGIYAIDKPYIEWRNRVRFIYKLNNLFSTSISGEPYLRFSNTQRGALTRARFVWNFNYRFNKFQTFSVFYLIQPDIAARNPKTNYVIGLTYHVRLPNKKKERKKFFNPKSLSTSTDYEQDTQN